MKLIKNKKGQAGELVQDSVGLIVIALLLLILFLISNALWRAPKKEIKTIATEQAIHDQEHLSLQAFLQKTTEVEIEGKKQEMTISDLIRLSKIDSKYKSVLEQERKKAFDDLYDYKFEIKSPKNIVQTEYKLETIAGIPMLIPTIRVPGSWFYVPSEEIIVANLEVKKIK